MTTPSQNTSDHTHKIEHHLFRFHRPHTHLSSVFGNDWFALKAEAFARFFGTLSAISLRKRGIGRTA